MLEGVDVNAMLDALCQATDNKQKDKDHANH
jgi:hypothetical protein